MKACSISTNSFKQMIGMHFIRTFQVGAAGWLVLRTFHPLFRFSRRSPQIILSYSLTGILFDQR
jgi:hypothetical protein